MSSRQAKVRLSKSVDIKAFPVLMEKHEITIIEKIKETHGVVFKLKAGEAKVEDIMIYTHMEWEFAA